MLHPRLPKPTCWTRFPSPVGSLLLTGTESQLTGVSFEAGVTVQLPRHSQETPALPLFVQARRWLTEYFLGVQPSPDSIPIALHGSDFQLAVWEKLQYIPYGTTVSYGELSRQLIAEGLSSCPQAVGHAVGRNPIAIIVPCHRVIGFNGSLTGFAGGLSTKKYLLEHEQHTVKASP